MCRTFKLARSTLDDAEANGAEAIWDKGSERPVPARPGFGIAPLAVSRGEAGVRTSAAQVAAAFPTLDQRSPGTGELVRKTVAGFVAQGWRNLRRGHARRGLVADPKGHGP